MLIEHVLRSPAVGSAPVCPCELDGVSPETTRRDVIEGSPSQVARATDTASIAVLLGRTSTRSRPSAHLTDEAEEVDRCVMREPPPPL